MDLQNVIMMLEDVQKELTQTLVDGVEDYPSYRDIKGQINGLARAKNILSEELTKSDIDSPEDEDD